MRRKPRSSEDVRHSNEFEMEMTPMIDVTFLVLIFFMCTLKFKTLEGQLSAYLPKDVGPNTDFSETLEPLDVAIHVRAEGTKLGAEGRAWSPNSSGRFRFASDRVVDYSIGPKRGLDMKALRAELAGLDAQTIARGVALDAGAGTIQAEAIEVLDVLVGAGVEEIRIQGAKGN